MEVIKFVRELVTVKHVKGVGYVATFQPWPRDQFGARWSAPASPDHVLRFGFRVSGLGVSV